MKISKENKKILDAEFNFVVEKMENARNPEEILYYFTGFFNMIQRIYNLEFSQDLLFVFVILENTYRIIMDRVNLLQSGQPGHTVIPFPENFGGKLINLTKSLKNNFYNKDKRIQILKDFTLLSYITTGNGYYLTQKGLLNQAIQERLTFHEED